MKNPTVYVVQDLGNKDFSAALQFGQLEVLMSHDLPVYGDATNHIMRLQQKLLEFDPLSDYVLPTGDPLAIGAVYAILAKAGHPQIPSLKWDRQNRSYRIVKIPVPLKGSGQ